jgi:hypothetical protein
VWRTTFLPNFEWQLLSRTQDGERIIELSSATVPNGTLYKNQTSYLDKVSGLVKTSSESTVFVSNTIGPGPGPGPFPGTVLSILGEADGVVSGIETTVDTLTIPSGHSGFLYRIEFSGTNSAMYKVYINGTLQSQGLTPIIGPYDGSFNYSAGVNGGLPLNQNDQVVVTVIHSRPDPGDFTSRIQYLLN